jgi:hypothetical protein
MKDEMGGVHSTYGDVRNARKFVIGRCEHNGSVEISDSDGDNIVTCYLVTRSIICGFWIFYSVYWICRQAEFTITYYSLNFTVNALR